MANRKPTFAEQFGGALGTVIGNVAGASYRAVTTKRSFDSLYGQYAPKNQYEKVYGKRKTKRAKSIFAKPVRSYRELIG